MKDEKRSKGQITDKLENGKARVTNLLPSNSGAVTDRLDNETPPDDGPFHQKHVTDILSIGRNGRPTSSRIGVNRGDLVADRYYVEEGPLGQMTGEAEIFYANDQVTEEKVVLKFYLPDISPKKAVLDQLLNLEHPSIVSIRDFGEWRGRFFEIMEFCEGGSLVDFVPYGEDLLREYLKQVVIGLKFCHDQGIVHRDIKPHNLFFRKTDRKDVVIGDFGISSILMEGEKVHYTSTAGALTPDYASPDLLQNNRVSAKTDYYSLGVTLIHLVTGHSPFEGMDIRSIHHSHIFGKVPIPETISDIFKRLIKGLIRVDDRKRWGFKQAMAWLHGETVLTDEGQPDREDIYAGRGHPYPECKEATTPIELANYLEDFNAENALFRGRISDWIYVHFEDAELAKKIEAIEENYTEKRALGLFKLRYTLNPSLSLSINGHPVSTIEDLVELLKSSDEGILSSLEDVLWGEKIECWIDATIRDERAKELVEKIGSIRKRLKNRNRRLALLSMLYTLDPSLRFKLAKNAEISRPEELEEVLAKSPDLLPVVLRFLYEGQFEEWLLTAFPDRDKDYATVVHCRKTYQNDEDLGVYALRWHFKPSVPFPFDGEKAKRTKDLARLIDKNEAGRKRGIELLSNGWIRTWLESTTKNWAPEKFDRLINESGASWDRKLEAVLHLLDPDLPWPEVATNKTKVKVGKVGTESSKTVEIEFRNVGRGFLSGTFSLQGQGEGFVMEPVPLEGGPTVIKVMINPQGLPVGSRQRKEVVVEYNGGKFKIPISYKVAAPLGKMILRSSMAGALCAVVLGLYRAVILLALPTQGTLNWYDWNRTKTILSRADMILWMALLVGIIGGGIYYLARMNKIHEKK